MKVAIVGDSFKDIYCFGEVNRISPEAPVPVLDVERTEIRSGGALNVAINLQSLGISPTVFTIIDSDYVNPFPFEVISPRDCISLMKTRFVCQNQQLLRVDEPQVYQSEDLERVEYPGAEFDLVVFVDYNKGIVKDGKATVVDSKKTDLTVFSGSEYLTINQKEYASAIGKTAFPNAFVTKGKNGIDYYRNGEFVINAPACAKEVIDVTGAGDTVTAILVYCLVNGITDPVEMMKLANKAAGIVISRFGTSNVTLEELNHED